MYIYAKPIIKDTTKHNKFNFIIFYTFIYVYIKSIMKKNTEKIIFISILLIIMILLTGLIVYNSLFFNKESFV